jgi:glycosyltransferase involved in cell wall biosynthesis
VKKKPEPQAQAGSKPKRLFIAGHVSEVYGPVQALRHWVQLRGHQAAFLTHPFPYCGVPASRLERVDKGRQSSDEDTAKRSSLTPWQFLRNALSDLYQGWRYGPVDAYIGIGNLNVLPGLVLRFFGFADQVGYYVIDHTPGRFGNPVLNAIYRWVDILACKHADFLWCLSPRITEAKVERGAKRERCLDCPVGVQLERVQMAPPAKRRRQVLAVMSHLTKEKGIQLVLDSVAAIRKRHPKAVVEVIGTGPYEAELKAQAARLKLGSSVKFLGLMDHQQLFKHLPTCGIALATYTEDGNNIAYYADPTKPKEYLACGLPLIITKVPWTWEKVADKEHPMGVAIRYTQDDLVKALDKLLGDKRFYDRCRKNALAWTSTLRYELIFDKAWARAQAL